MTIPSQVVQATTKVQELSGQYDTGLEGKTEVPESAGVFTDIVFADYLPQEKVPTPAETHAQEYAEGKARMLQYHMKQASAVPFKRKANGKWQ